jgi:Gpi18-like mannosyltransferase
MLLMALFPGSFVLSFTYSEATMLVFASGCLLCLHRQQWLAAGVLGALGAATRPNGIALIVACFIAAVFAVKERREWRSLVAAAIAPLGFIGFHLFLWRRNGEALGWFRTQSEAWDEGTSFGLTAINNTIDAFVHPLSSPTDVITAASFIAMLILLYAAYKKRLPPAIVAYTAVVLLLMLAPSTVTARPRFLYTAFPLLISAAAWIRELEVSHEHGPAELSSGHEVWTVVLGLCAAGLVTLTGLYGVLGAIP